MSAATATSTLHTYNMPTAMTFMGDIITLCQLIVKAAMALCESEISREHSQIMTELDGLYSVLQNVKTLRRLPPHYQAGGTLGMIHKGAKACETVIQDWVIQGAPLKDEVKTSWAVHAPEGAAALRRLLSFYRQVFGSLLNEFHFQRQGERSVLRPRQLDPLTETITVVDVVGTRMSVPVVFCRTYKLLQEVLEAYYKNADPPLPSRDSVVRGDYRLVYRGGESAIDTLNWRLPIFSGSVLEIRMVPPLKRDDDEHHCPRCRISIHVEPIDEWMSCPACQEQFQVNREATELISLSISPTLASTSTTAAPTPSQQSSTGANRANLHTPNRRIKRSARGLRKMLNSALTFARSAVQYDADGDYTLAISDYRQTIILVDRYIALIRRQDPEVRFPNAEAGILRLEQIRNTYQSRIQIYNQMCNERCK